MSVYFDTNVIRHLRKGLREQSLPQEVKNQVVLSPLSVLELVSQIAAAPNDALSAIHAMRSWMDPDHAELLGWVDVFVAHWVFSREIPDETSKGLRRVLTACYVTQAPDDKLCEDARALLNFLTKAKQRKATLLSDAASAIRQRPEDNSNENLRGAARLALADGLRAKAGLTPQEIGDDAIAACLPGYFEYHMDLVARAIPDDKFDFFSAKHLNDHLDAEQLLFLADSSLHYFTADKGYCCAAKVEPRIHVLEARKLEDPAIAADSMTEEINKVAERQV